MPTMFYKYSGEEIVGYRFGDGSQAIALLVDGGYPTEEEAVLAWYKERKEKQECQEHQK
ncbi:MAG: hypothetical protein IKY90_08945 [Oscillospiraceae bacterium]|nr:hypothetical protein [Oscillospiraceae bacterium]